MNHKKFSIGQALKYSFSAVLSHLSIYLPAALVYVGLSAAIVHVFSFNAYDMAQLKDKGFMDPEFLAYVKFGLVKFWLSLLVSYVFNIGLTNVGLKIYDKKDVSVKDFFSGYPFFRALGAIFLVQIISSLGMMLLVVPGIVWAVKYMFTSFLVIDKNLYIKESLKLSGVVTYSAKLKLFFMVLALVLVLISFIFVLGFFGGASFVESSLFTAILIPSFTGFVAPVFATSMVYVYKQLLSQVTSEELEEAGLSLDKLSL